MYVSCFHHHHEIAHFLFYFILFQNNNNATTARPVHSRSEPPDPVHDVHPASPTRVRPRDASLSATHMRACHTSLSLFFTPFHDAVLQLVLADKYDSYRMTYEGCHVFNPGRFLGRSLGFSTYTPASRESEAWYVTLSVHFLPLPPSRSTRHASGTKKQGLHLSASWTWKPRINDARRYG
jgi:hypothetical protein